MKNHPSILVLSLGSLGTKKHKSRKKSANIKSITHSAGRRRRKTLHLQVPHQPNHPHSPAGPQWPLANQHGCWGARKHLQMDSRRQGCRLHTGFASCTWRCSYCDYYNCSFAGWTPALKKKHVKCVYRLLSFCTDFSQRRSIQDYANLIRSSPEILLFNDLNLLT